MDYVWGLFSLEDMVDELELEPALGTEILDPWFLAYWGSRKVVFVAEDGFQVTDSQILYASLAWNAFTDKKTYRMEPITFLPPPPTNSPYGDPNKCLPPAHTRLFPNPFSG
jgi:hypothetical protein